ncbi:MAG: hypothetical protein R2713_08940 [Ilumatobacteraceae bacterium]
MSQVVYYVAATPARRPAHVLRADGQLRQRAVGVDRTQRMGAPIEQFVVASNTNDILTRFLRSNDMSTADVVPTHGAPAWTSRCRPTSSGCCSR